MRLNSELGGAGRQPKLGIGLEHVEKLLRDAADYEPQIQPVDDFVRKALGARARRRPVRFRALAFTFSSGVAAAAILVFMMSRNDDVRNTFAMGEKGPSNDVIQPLDPGGVRPGSGGSEMGGTKGSSPGRDTQRQGSGSALPVRENHGTEEPGGDFAPVKNRHSSIQTASLREKRGGQDRERESTIPKVRWHNEVVQRYDRGVIAPAYVVEERDRNGDVVYQPVMMPVTTETGARPLLVDGMPDTSIQVTNRSEETSTK